MTKRTRIDKTERFPFDEASDRVLRQAAELDPADHSRGAEYLREVAGSIRDHREASDQAPHWGATQWARDNVGLD